MISVPIYTTQVIRHNNNTTGSTCDYFFKTNKNNNNNKAEAKPNCNFFYKLALQKVPLCKDEWILASF
jgi:hypothetical protein